MNDLRHYAGELEQMQSLPLEIKNRSLMNLKPCFQSSTKPSLKESWKSL